MRAVLVAAGALLGLAVSTWTSASPITWHMTGAVSTGNGGDFFFPFKVNAGDPIAMDIRFESETTCSICADTQRSYDNALISLTVTVHDTAFALPIDTSSIGILNDFASPAGFFIDAFDVASSGTDASGI